MCTMCKKTDSLLLIIIIYLLFGKIGDNVTSAKAVFNRWLGFSQTSIPFTMNNYLSFPQTKSVRRKHAHTHCESLLQPRERKKEQ